MARTDPLPDWTGADAYLIGGGPSLRSFIFSKLAGRNVIGCNQAFMLGHEIVTIAAFGDYKFWVTYQAPLSRFPGWVATNYHTAPKPDWVNQFKRVDEGLATNGSLAWNANTGSMAINLALTLGAKRVFLLGYDSAAVQVPVENRTERKTHWHVHNTERQGEPQYKRFNDGHRSIAEALPVVFPGREVINITDGTSKVTAFPCVTFEEAGLK